MAHHLREKIKTTGLKEVLIEGIEQNDWVLIDGRDVVIHLFRPEVREFYALEKMWGDEILVSGDVAEI
jgi:ribosome-associated protein